MGNLMILKLFSAALILFSCNNAPIKADKNNSDTKKQINNETAEIKESTRIDTIDIGLRFYASGWLGDGATYGKKAIIFQDNCSNKPYSPPICFKVVYIPQTVGWAGIYWQNRPNNFGKVAGENYSNKGYSKITFWARGETGTELIEFKSGGINSASNPNGNQYRDTYEVSTGKIVLGREWRKYTINLEGQNLSSVIGGFC
jgi:hypothetical protein